MHQAHGVAGELDLLGFLLLGLLGSATHCSVMCAPFALLVSDRFARPRCERPVMQAQLWYAAGRMATYAALGAAAGSIGALFEFAGAWAGVGRAAATIAGVALILSAALSLMNGRLRLEPSSRGLGRITRLLQRRVPAHPFVLGVVLGLLPCGLLYSAVTAAVARGTPAAGAFALAVFAAGTTPSLLGIAFARHQLTRHATRFVSLSQAFVLVMGIWYFWRGIGS